MSEEKYELKDEELKSANGGDDIPEVRIHGKDVPLPEAKSKKPIDGGYAGNIKPIDEK